MPDKTMQISSATVKEMIDNSLFEQGIDDADTRKCLTYDIFNAIKDKYEIVNTDTSDGSNERFNTLYKYTEEHKMKVIVIATGIVLCVSLSITGIALKIANKIVNGYYKVDDTYYYNNTKILGDRDWYEYSSETCKWEPVGGVYYDRMYRIDANSFNGKIKFTDTVYYNSRETGYYYIDNDYYYCREHNILQDEWYKLDDYGWMKVSVSNDADSYKDCKVYNFEELELLQFSKANIYEKATEDKIDLEEYINEKYAHYEETEYGDINTDDYIVKDFTASSNTEDNDEVETEEETASAEENEWKPMGEEMFKNEEQFENGETRSDRWSEGETIIGTGNQGGTEATDDNAGENQSGASEAVQGVSEESDVSEYDDISDIKDTMNIAIKMLILLAIITTIPLLLEFIIIHI